VLLGLDWSLHISPGLSGDLCRSTLGTEQQEDQP
jgi:hypothetical protein